MKKMTKMSDLDDADVFSKKSYILEFTPVGCKHLVPPHPSCLPKELWWIKDLGQELTYPTGHGWRLELSPNDYVKLVQILADLTPSRIVKSMVSGWIE